MLSQRRELPGDVIEVLRRQSGYVKSKERFARRVGFSLDTLRRLELVKWCTEESDWFRAVEHYDLEAFVNAGLIEEGDDWWMRFITAFAWQDIVMRYGKAAYTLDEAYERLIAPVMEQHAIALVQAVAEREIRKLARSGKGLNMTDERREALVDKVTGEVLFRLSTTGLILTKEFKGKIIPEEERTRALQDVLVEGPAVESPYVRTLRLAYDWAEQMVERALGEAD
jgi:hypothetical protein